VVLLEVQMHAKPGFKHRLCAQSFRFLQLHPQVQHLAVVVVVPHRRSKLGPDQLPQQLPTFLDGVIWLSLEELGQKRSSSAAPSKFSSSSQICCPPFSLCCLSGFPHSLPRRSW